jgi:hypothetical protein
MVIRSQRAKGAAENELSHAGGPTSRTPHDPDDTKRRPPMVHHLPVQSMNFTITPGFTMPASSSTSQFVRRMQP